jgi:ubiquinone/menaquinone biosynthesis C-methylase UbiE
MTGDIDRVRSFWNINPLFTGEADTKDIRRFFVEHDRAYFDDVFRGVDQETVFFWPMPGDRVLDVRCGIGFWVSQFEKRGNADAITGFDLSSTSIGIARQRTSSVEYVEGNCEALPFEDASFDFVNCQGVVHHTPDTQAALNEIHRVLRPGGRASISVYYENLALRAAPTMLGPIRLVARLFLRNLGRSRDFTRIRSKDDIVRIFDGADNPIGKCYSQYEFKQMLKRAGFGMLEFRFFFFPFRFLKLPIPAALSGLMVRTLPFMIVANLVKSDDAPDRKS